ncbi:MAG: helix-turn-helix transcriptional regulator [Clostridia bacterium]|nr:helix-turn-helix transcriptional regulator [Clostridia bacterium]
MKETKIISFYKDDSIACAHSIVYKPNDGDFKFHTHDICEIIFLKSGDISAVIGEKTYKMQKDSLVIFRSNIPHRIRIDGSENYERYNILFNENELANGIFHKLPKELDLINCNGNAQIIKLFEKIDYYYSKFSGENFKILVKNIVEEILFNLYAEPFEDFSVNQASVHPIISSAVNYINEHYKEPVTIDDICRDVCVTKSHLHHLFMKNMKISPKKYVNMRRLSKAQKLIAMGEKPTVIYTECGFTDYGTFFRNYTNYFGYSPSRRDEIATERKIQ